MTMCRDIDLMELEGIMLQRRGEYLDQAEVITRMLLSQLPDRDAVKAQDNKKRDAFPPYRRARTASLAAVSGRGPNERPAA